MHIREYGRLYAWAQKNGATQFGTARYRGTVRRLRQLNLFININQSINDVPTNPVLQRIFVWIYPILRFRAAYVSDELVGIVFAHISLLATIGTSVWISELLSC